MSDAPSLWRILDSHLNTGDYHDGFDGYINVDANHNETEFLIKFESAEDNTVMTYFLVKPS